MHPFLKDLHAARVHAGYSILCSALLLKPVLMDQGADVDPSVFLSPWQCWEGRDQHELGQDFQEQIHFHWWY